MLMGYQHYT